MKNTQTKKLNKRQLLKGEDRNEEEIYVQH